MVLGPKNKELMKINTFKDATYAVEKTMPEKFRLLHTAYINQEPICDIDLQLPVGLPAQLVRALH